MHYTELDDLRRSIRNGTLNDDILTNGRMRRIAVAFIEEQLADVAEQDDE